MKPKYRVPLVNLDVIGQMCGHGEGNTLQEAIDDAMRRAGEGAYYSQQMGAVVFHGGCYC